MRASQVSVFLVACALGCSSSSTPAPSGDGGGADASGDSGSADVTPLPDGRITLSGDGARALAQNGDPCLVNNDCYGRGCQMGRDGFPGGYCVADCRMGQTCMTSGSGRATCTSLNADTPACYKTCMSDSDCRAAEGYFCLDVGAHNTIQGGQKVCYPKMLPLNCNYNVDCPPSVPVCTGGLDPDAGIPDSGLPMPGNGTCGP